MHGSASLATQMQRKAHVFLNFLPQQTQLIKMIQSTYQNSNPNTEGKSIKQLNQESGSI